MTSDSSSPGPGDPVAALNQVLSEVLDVVQETKQAHRKVPENHELHDELDELFDDLRSWAQRLMVEDEALGTSPLGRMPSVAGRTPPNLWPGDPSDEDVRRTLAEHLEWLRGHVAVAREEQLDGGARTALFDVERGIVHHLEELRLG
ncbi:MAG TPA: hypothetical protein VEJ44_01790 [Acidimicrobiales bacterium]|nr:hypothetical protein [Acidimicrobiales bacterium]